MQQQIKFALDIHNHHGIKLTQNNVLQSFSFTRSIFLELYRDRLNTKKVFKSGSSNCDRIDLDIYATGQYIGELVEKQQ